MPSKKHASTKPPTPQAVTLASAAVAAAAAVGSLNGTARAMQTTTPKTSPPMPTPPVTHATAVTATPVVLAASALTLPALRRLLQTAGAVGVHFQMVQDEAVPVYTHTQQAAPQRRQRLAAVALAASSGEQRAEEASTTSLRLPLVIYDDGNPTNGFVELVRMVLADNRVTKTVLGVFDVGLWLVSHGAVPASGTAGRIDATPVAKCVDLQLYYEHFADIHERAASLLKIANHLGVDPTNVPYGDVLRHEAATDDAQWAKRPLPRVCVLYAVGKAQAYAECFAQMRSQAKLSTAALLWLQEITFRRWQYASRYETPLIWFDEENDYVPRSIECLGAEENLEARIPLLVLQCEIDSLLQVLPSRYRDVITAIDSYKEKLVDVCLDAGRVPHAYVGRGQRVVLNASPRSTSMSSFTMLTRLLAVGDENTAKEGADCVTLDEIRRVLDRIGGEAKIGSDNRVGIDRQLHRISVMRSKTNEIYGLTLRVGRTLQFASNFLLDLLLSSAHRSKSVLLLGRPGSGKTTLIRDIAQCVSARGENVCIIDTSNEIGGDGLVPHECIGWARRMMVKSLDDQASVMVECVQNHTVETLIVDEIGRKAEVNAAGTVRQRGPRLIASAHGDLRSLIKNQDLKGLIGGVQSVTVGDEEAKKNTLLGKVQAKRSGNPIFDVIVELDEVHRGRCRIIWDVARAVDAVLAGNSSGYKYETRYQAFGLRGVQVLDRGDD